ncbi:phage tail tape measure protein [Streptomyces sp. bgisy031]|uniref:phage tail tape measure protein n=1 Tax=Streptomyces sp. bgisy031 TaxID=3413772 RepID=UPI003D703BF3
MPNVGFAVLQIIPSVRGIGRDIERQLTGPAGTAGQRAGDAAGGGFKEKLKAGAAAAGLAAGALVAKGLKDAVEQANITNALQAQLGATGKDAAKYGKVAGKLYSSGVSGSFQEAADAIKSVVQSGLAPPDATNSQLQAIATKAQDVSTVFGQDLGGVTNAVSQMMRTGLAKNSTEAFDVITKGFQSGADKGGDLLDTVNEYGVQFKKAGLDGATAMGLLNQAIKGGARDSDVAADAIKEFSIRAVDGSASTKAGFKALGLSADDMATKFGKGGKTSKAALDLTLDRLRGIKDPVKQSAAATALFGTQAEDLGSALFAMDPSKAATGLGKVGGAADKAGKLIRSGPSHAITTFGRTLQQGLVDILGTYLIPALTDLAKYAKTAWGWIKDNQAWLAPFGAGIAVIASGIGLYVAYVKVVALVTRAWAAAQVLMNTVMSANPIGLIILGVVALGAALVVAYKKSETFRSIVQGAWNGIKTAASFVWNSILKPAFEGIKTGLSAVGAAFVWLWNNAVKPVAGWIKAGFQLLWAGVKLVFGYFKQGLRTLGGVAKWLWTNAIKPVVGWIKQGFATLWSGVKLVFGYFKEGLKTLGGVFKWLWDHSVKPAWNGIKAIIKGVYDNGIKPVFSALKGAVKKVGESFEAARKAIKIAWDKVKGIAKAPIAFVINTVYNGGIVPVWNKVASAFGAPTLKPIKGWATGGPVFGAGTETSDDVPAWLSKNEHVWTAKEVRGAGGHGAVAAMRSWAAAGGNGSAPGFKDGGGLFGWIGKGASKVAGWGSSAWDKVKAGAKWLKDTLGASARAGVNAVVKPLLRNIPGLKNGFGKMVAKIPDRMVDSLFGYADKADKKGASTGSFGGGKIPKGQHLAVINAALKAARVPPPGTLGQWQSGLNTLITRESGWNASAINRWDSNAKAGHPSQGLAQTIPGTFNAYVPKSLKGRGILDPVANVAAAIRYIVSRYGNITRVQQANAHKAPAGYDSGGWLQPGFTAAVNKTGRPEAVLTASQWRVASSAMAGGGVGDLHVRVFVGDREITEIARTEVRNSQKELISVIRSS